MALESLNAIELPQDRIILAQDQDTWADSLPVLDEVAEAIGLAKYNSLADEVGPESAIAITRMRGVLTFLDYKLHDVDDTMLRRARALTAHGAAMITVHGSNSPTALLAAMQGVNEALAADSSLERPWLLGVTVLTSVTDEDEVCTSIYGADRKTKVRDFAHRAADAGFEGIVCSPQEAEMIKSDSRTQHMKAVLPAIRPEYAVENDEQRAVATTPRVAIEAGGDLLVIGRPLAKAMEKYGIPALEAAHIIGDEIAAATS